MAGIGFRLRDLARRDNLTGPLAACLYAALVSVGPWIFTMVTLGLLRLFMAGGEVSDAFQLTLIYNFGISLLVTSPLSIAVTRYVADKVFDEELEAIPGSMLVALPAAALLSALFAAPLHFLVTKLPLEARWEAVVNAMLLGALWIGVVFLTTLRSYHAVAAAFFFGALAALGKVAWRSAPLDVQGGLAAFDCGLAVTLALVVGRVLAEYPYPLRLDGGCFPYFRKFWELALGSLLLQIGLWGDKVAMWSAPEASGSAIGLVSYPAYDQALFMAQLVAIPSLALFVFYAETDFYETFRRFTARIFAHGSLERIKEAHHDVVDTTTRCVVESILVQLPVTIVAVLSAPRVVELLGLPFESIGIFRFAAIGNVFFSLSLFLLVFLAYFDARKKLLGAQAVFAVASIGGAVLSRFLGVHYYGYGHLAASLALFFVSLALLWEHLAKLPYHTFITHNSSLGERA